LNPPSSDRIITTKAASASITTSAERPILCAVLHIVAQRVRPAAIAGAGVPGFPVTDAIVTNSITGSWVHLISPQTVQTVRASAFRNVFLAGQAVNHAPASDLGFNTSLPSR